MYAKIATQTKNITAPRLAFLSLTTRLSSAGPAVHQTDSVFPWVLSQGRLTNIFELIRSIDCVEKGRSNLGSFAVE
jgi:hypothetical protein